MLCPRCFVQEQLTQRRYCPMIGIQKNLPYLITNGTPSWLSSHFTGSPSLYEVSFQALNLSGLSTPLHSFEGDKERQLKTPSVEWSPTDKPVVPPCNTRLRPGRYRPSVRKRQGSRLPKNLFGEQVGGLSAISEIRRSIETSVHDRFHGDLRIVPWPNTVIFCAGG